jgi:hypothetical protein
MVVLSGLAGLLGTRLLVDIFRGSAVRVEHEATVSASLRAKVVADSILIASPSTATQQTWPSLHWSSCWPSCWRSAWPGA